MWSGICTRILCPAPSPARNVLTSRAAVSTLSALFGVKGSQERRKHLPATPAHRFCCRDTFAVLESYNAIPNSTSSLPPARAAMNEHAVQHWSMRLLLVNDIYCDVPIKGRGGYAPLGTMLNERRAEWSEKGPCITVVGGDVLGGSALADMLQGEWCVTCEIVR